MILFLADLKVQWVIYSAIALLGTVFVLAFPDKQRLLSTVFILSLQVEVFVRLLYGRAQGEGLAIPMVVLTGAALFGWYAITGHLRDFTSGGSMRRPIIALMVTTILSMLDDAQSDLSASPIFYIYWSTTFFTG